MGSYTGEVSGEALKSLGVKYVFINHSERRHLNNEPLELAKEKLIRAKEAGLIPILCVGEEDGEDAVEVLTHDLNYLLKDLNIDNLYISYEPCYAIGSGNIPSREKLVTVFNYLKENYNYPLLYGGSVSKDTIEQLKDIPYLEGMLLGKASLRIENVKDFIDKL